jgi:chromosome partitioning protein
MRTYNRAIDAFDSVVDEIENEIQNAWKLQLVKEGGDGEQ